MADAEPELCPFFIKFIHLHCISNPIQCFSTKIKR